MGARHWMIGCLIGLVGVGSAMAADVSACDTAAGSHSAVESSSRDNDSGGDVVELNREHAAPRHASSAGGSDADNHGGAGGSSQRGGHSSVPSGARATTLGWQSLLPGSIQ